MEVKLLLLAGLFAVLAYVVLPLAWRAYELRRKIQGLRLVTHTAQGIPGDPLNVGLVGDEADVVRAMHAGGWYPADPITLRTSVEIVGSVLLRRQYRHAPVSSLYLLGRREDLAFEKPAGKSAGRRNHVRLWTVIDAGEAAGRVWLGSATFDRSVGFSHYTGAITHHIDPDIDRERNLLMDDLWQAGMLAAVHAFPGIGRTAKGRNGEGDRYFTDGEIHLGQMLSRTPSAASDPAPLAVSPASEAMQDLWDEVLASLANTRVGAR